MGRDGAGDRRGSCDADVRPGYYRRKPPRDPVFAEPHCRTGGLRKTGAEYRSAAPAAIFDFAYDSHAILPARESSTACANSSRVHDEGSIAGYRLTNRFSKMPRNRFEFSPRDAVIAACEVAPRTVRR